MGLSKVASDRDARENILQIIKQMSLDNSMILKK